MAIYGTSLSNTLNGTSGNDVIYGYPASGLGSGANDYDGYDTLYGYGGNDALYGGNQSDILYGGSGKDKLYGGNGNDNLYGGSGNDILYGGAGNDRLDGYSSGTEYDTLVGGAGSDTFILGSGFRAVSYQGLGYATITDWNASADYIQITGSSSQYSLRYAFLSGGSAQDTQIYYFNDLIAVVQDTTNVSISRDFKFV